MNIWLSEIGSRDQTSSVKALTLQDLSPATCCTSKTLEFEVPGLGFKQFRPGALSPKPLRVSGTSSPKIPHGTLSSVLEAGFGLCLEIGDVGLRGLQFGFSLSFVYASLGLARLF